MTSTILPKGKIMPEPLRAVKWDRKSVLLIDQRLLPFEEKWLVCDTVEKVARAIEDMVVRGAPAIGVTAAYGVAVGARRAKRLAPPAFERSVGADIKRLRRTRPTAVNLFWALDAMERALKGTRGMPSDDRASFFEHEAKRIHLEDEALCAGMGSFGSALLSKHKNILTHCNTGALATGGDGTALAAILYAAKKNPRLHVWVDETRPYLQGARLTAYELHRAGVPFHIITDNMAASLMKDGKVDAIIVGADRIAANGDTANKIGTYSLAVLAKAHQIPFYIAAPTSTFDLTIADGAGIPIEQRDPAEVTHPRGLALTRRDFPVFNPSFDVTPGNLIAGIVCEKGVCRAPYRSSLRKALKSREGSFK
jgi:methylthioribose-1-phosphate isomerase